MDAEQLACRARITNAHWVRVLLTIILVAACGDTDDSDNTLDFLAAAQQGECSNLGTRACSSKSHCQVAFVKTGLGSWTFCLELRPNDVVADAGCTLRDAGCTLRDAGCTLVDAGCGWSDERCAQADHDTCRAQEDCTPVFWTNGCDTGNCGSAGVLESSYRSCERETLQ